jgi:hypothetical protein
MRLTVELEKYLALQGATAADSQRVFGNYELERGMKISDESC